MLIPVLLVALNLAAAPATQANAVDGKALLGGEAPLDFRCDNMQVFTKPNRTVCKANVVVRRGDLLVCCTTFEGFAAANWGWERFVCTENVRAQRGDEIMWSDKAEFLLATQELFLTGRPRLKRGKSLMEGDRIVVDVKNDQAKVEKPRGRFESAPLEKPVETLPPIDPTLELQPLPGICPLPAAPGR